MKIRTCYMCDKPATSREHVPPIGFFPDADSIGRDLRRNLITVPSCDEHNGKKSEDDEFLRATVCLATAGRSEVATHQFKDRVLAGAEKRPAKYAKFAPRVEIPMPEGRAVFRMDRPRFDRCMDHITRALCFHHFGEKWPNACAVVSPHFFASQGALLSYPSYGPALIEATRNLLATEPVQGENRDVFMYRIKRGDEWLAFACIFYDAIEVYAYSTPAIAADLAARTASP